jgi:hypothetical protein
MGGEGDVDTPPRPRALASTVAEDGDAIAVSVREGSRGAAAFLAVWLVIWTVGCVFLAGEALTTLQLFDGLVCIPFWAGWVFGAVFLVTTVFGRQRVSLDPDGLAYERWLPLMKKRRFVPLAELGGIESRVIYIDTEGNATQGIEIRTLGRSITTGTALPPMERDWLAERLDRHRRRLQSEAGMADDTDLDPGDCRDCKAPTDCTWSTEDDFEGPQFVQRGRFEMGTVFGVLFATLFWNAVVGVFVALLAGLDGAVPAPRDGFLWWFMFVFLIPFEVIGLAMFFGLLAAFLEPVRVTRWRFGRDAVARVTTRAGLPLGWNSRSPHDGLATASVLGDLAPRGLLSMETARSSGAPTGTRYGLRVADRANVEVCTIPGLTLGEARWIKGRLQAAGLIG